MKYRLFCLVTALVVLLPRAAEPATPPAADTDTASHAVLQAGKNTRRESHVHRFEKLRAGAIKTANGWNVQDFASSFFNPNPRGNHRDHEDGQRRSEVRLRQWSSRHVHEDFQAAAHAGRVRITSTSAHPPSGSPSGLWRPRPTSPVPWSSPVPSPSTTTSCERTTLAKPPMRPKRTLRAGNRGGMTCLAAWDDDLKQFVVPYTNYWHNEKQLARRMALAADPQERDGAGP